MMEVLNTFNQHAQAETSGMHIDWKGVARAMAVDISTLIQAEQAKQTAPIPERIVRRPRKNKAPELPSTEPGPKE